MFSAAKIAAPTSSGYNLTNSLRFRASASAYLSKTFGAGTSDQKMAISVWVKRGVLATQQAIFTNSNSTPGTNEAQFQFNSTNNLRFYSQGGTVSLITSQTFVDPSAWYHLYVAIDTTQATAANRILMYVNGAQVTAFSTANYPTQNTNIQFNNAYLHSIGDYQASGVNFFDGYMAEFNFIDGSAPAVTSFGSFNATTGVWQPTKYSGTYGTNGFYLPFSNTASTTTLGYDLSGNSNNWTTNNISLTAGYTYDSMTDVPTLTSATVANYCTLNPLTPQASSIVDQGNLRFNNTNASTSYYVGGTQNMYGKQYFEITISNTVSGAYPNIGLTIQNTISQYYGTYLLGRNSVIGGIGYGPGNGTLYIEGSLAATYATAVSGDIIQIAYDTSTGNVWVGKNNTWFNSGNPAAGTGYVGTLTSNILGITPAICSYNSNNAQCNFGQQPFTYTPPTGFVALNAYNLLTGTILQGNKYMDATLYTGNGSTQSIVNAGAFQPDLVVFKDRTSTYDPTWYDSVRGVQKYLASDSTAVEGTSSTGLSSFNSNGFTTGSAPSSNNNGDALVAWQWKASGTTVSNTNGSITSTVSVNASAGFSVVTYTGTGTNGATVGHGLGVVPAFFVTKARNTGSTSWQVYHQSLGATYLAGYLDSTAASFASSIYWNNTAPTSSVFSLGTSSYANVSGQTQVAYCWAAIAGFSAFGSFTGNGSSSGPFVYCGFQPKWVMIFNTAGTYNWNILDALRSPYNTQSNYLAANVNSAEGSLALINTTANGFQIASSSGSVNGSGNTLIYAAFASNPFKNSLAF